VTEEYEFPVSAAQDRLLVLDRLNPGTAQYTMYAAYRVTGGLDVAAFERCVEMLVERHEALRTVFRVTDGEFVQVVRAEAPSPVRFVRAFAAEEADVMLREEADRAFDLENGPLLRVLVIEVEDGSHRILLAAHHVVADGWSLGLLVRELSDAYRDADADLPEPGLQYADYAVWQREQAATGEYDAQVAYWRDALKDAPVLLPLPADRPRPRVRTPAGGNHLFEVPDSTAAAVERIARACAVTPTAAWFAAFSVFLGRLSGRGDLVVGTPVAGRDRDDLHDVVGMLVNTVALRLDVSDAPSFRELITRSHGAFRGAQANQDAPFDVVVDALAPTRDLDHDPVYQVVFALENAEALHLQLAGAQTERLELFLDVAKFDFMAQAEKSGAHMAVRFVYRSELYTHSTIARWAGLFRTLVTELTAQEGRRSVAAASWLTNADRAALLDLATGPRQTADPGLTVVDLIDRQMRRTPDARAIVTRDETLTYAELDRRAARIAGYLVARGIGPGSIVGLCLPRAAVMPVAVLGVLKAGAAYLPLDPDYPADRLAFLAADAHADLILTSATIAEAELGEPLPSDHRGAGPRDVAYVIYTSGSTGRPKGVAIEHRSLADYVLTRRERFDVAEGGRLGLLGAFSFDITVSDMFLSWTHGAELHIASEDARLGAPLADWLRDSHISTVIMLPSMLASMPHSPGALPELSTLITGAEPLSAELVDRWAPGRTFRNAFGPTEATVDVTTADLRAGDRPVIGRPLPNTRVYVLDDCLEPSPVGIVGEIYIAGPGLARGYVGRTALTAERFVADRFGAPGDRMYRTGDLGRYLDSGQLDILGRADDQVKIRGYRIEPGEIEGALVAHPAVRLATVVARDDGGDDQRLIAYLVAEDGASPDAVADARLRAWLAERLPAHLVPALFVVLDALPTTSSGKVDKAALPAPAEARPQLMRAYVAPRTDLEHRIAGVWAQVLRLDRVGVQDVFFDLGGTSIRLLAVHNRLTTGPEPLAVDLVALFRHPTVAALAAHLGEAADTEPGEAATDRGADRRRRLDTLRRPRPGTAPNQSTDSSTRTDGEAQR
jgi:amino acid adenylation domain-containing protein